MKTKLLFVALIGLLVASVANAENVMKTPVNMVKVEIICIQGFAFAVAAHGGQMNAGRGVAITQVYKTVKEDLPPQPARCN